MGKIEINPASLLNAAKALQEQVKPDLATATTRLSASYHVDPPGWGLALSFLEAAYNSVGDYHVKNLQAAGEAVDAIAAGLRKTVDNYNLSEQANVEMMLGPSTDAEGYWSGLLDSGFVRTFHTLPHSGGEWATESVSIATQLAFVTIAFATASMAPDYLAAPIVAATLVTNGFSMFSAAREVAAVASALETDVNRKFDIYATGATSGWNDDSVIEYRSVITDMSRELTQAQKVVSSMSSVLTIVLALLTTFWVAFLAFTHVFFTTILSLTLESVGPQWPVVHAVIELLGAIASATWLTTVGTVMGLIGAAVAVLTGVIKEFTGMQDFDQQGDSTPDIRQIKIAWHSS